MSCIDFFFFFFFELTSVLPVPFPFVEEMEILTRLLTFRGFFFWEELGGPEKDLFVLVSLEKDCVFIVFLFRSLFFYCEDSAGFSTYSLTSKLDLGTLAALVGEYSSISLCLSESHLSFLCPWNSTA